MPAFTPPQHGLSDLNRGDVLTVMLQGWAIMPVASFRLIVYVAPNVLFCTGARKTGHLPLVAVVALIALPGVLTKQFVNCVQLKNAMASLVVYDQQKGQPGKTQ